MKPDDVPNMGLACVPPVVKPLSDSARAVISALREISYSEVNVVIHNAPVVQITRSQKFRFGDR